MPAARFAALLVLAGCVEHRDNPITGTQSLAVDLVDPSDPGAIDRRLPDTVRSVTISLTAKDIANQVDTSFADTVKVYAQFLGTLTPQLGQMPILEIPMTAGLSMNRVVTLPAGVFGPTTLWIDNGSGLGPDYVHGPVGGASQTLWFRDPFIQDTQRPRDETALDALARTPLDDKQVAVRASRWGGVGRLVVTSVFSQGYTVADVQCTDLSGKPPCTAGPYDHAMVFTFSAPRNGDGQVLQEGELIGGFEGGVSEFNGLTEIGFPRTFPPDKAEIDPAREPAPALLDIAWFAPLSDPAGQINFERNEAGPIEIRGAKACPLDADYDRFKQWKIAVDGDCSGTKKINVITAGTLSLDPSTLNGMTLPSVVGILRPVLTSRGPIWIIFPRGMSDLTLQ
jgi:hypothetical protein